MRALASVESEGVRFVDRDGDPLTAASEIGEVLAQAVAPGSVLDGELVALASTEDDPPLQDYAALGQALWRGDEDAARRMIYVAFDVLQHAGEDLSARPWRMRRERLEQLLAAPTTGRRLRLVEVHSAHPAQHDDYVRRGYEGSVLKDPEEPYQAGPSPAWLALRARRNRQAEILGIRAGHPIPRALCHDGERRFSAQVPAGMVHRLREGAPVSVAYSRLDADGTPRHARVVGENLRLV